MQIRFCKNNIVYSQDFRIHQGIQTGVVFTRQNICGANGRVELVGDGYGARTYGNGTIYVDKKDLPPIKNSPTHEICDNCEIDCREDDLQEVRIKNTRTNIFVCKACSEDIENYILVL